MGSTVQLSSAGTSDGEFLFRLRNDPDVRAQAFSPDPLRWSEHRAWLQERLSREKPHLYLIVLDGRPLGACRLDIDGERAEVTINLEAQARGKGLGTPALHALAEIARREGIRRLLAYVLPENQRSAVLFAKAGYRGPRRIPRPRGNSSADCLQFELDL